jgi:hypothetical protein
VRPSFTPIQNNPQNYVFVHLTFTFLGSKWEDKRLWTEWQRAFPEFSLLLISSCMQFSSVSVVPKHLNYATPSKDLFPIFMLCFCPAFLQHDIYLVFSGVTSTPTSLLASNRDSVFFLNGIYVFSHYINPLDPSGNYTPQLS